MNAPIDRFKTNNSNDIGVVEAIRDWFKDLFNLEEGMDQEGTLTIIKDNTRMRGANAWLLMCSIMIASLGLDLNSPAVIIGAMLISPLMSPILGIGLGVGINDREVLKESLRQFTIAVVIALLTSTFYFCVTPFGDYTSEINARTVPTLLDGLVAVFGGFAGIISITRKDKSNAIPGVAIATALMPPLCVSGYGIANGNWSVMFSSFYLFFLNTFFIATTTFLIIRLMRFPYHKHVNDKERRRTQLGIAIFSILMIVPSALILNDVVKKMRAERQAEKFTKAYFSQEPQALNHHLEIGDTTHVLFVTLLGPAIHPDSMDYLYEGLANHNMPNTELILIQDTDPEIQEVYKLQSEMKGFKHVASNLAYVNKVKAQKEKEVATLRSKLDSLQTGPVPIEMTLAKAKKRFKNLLGIQKMDTSQDSVYREHPVILVQWKDTKKQNKIEKDEKKLYKYLLKQTRLDSLELLRY